MWRLVGLVSLLFAWACPTIACTVTQTYDPNRVFKVYSRDQIVSTAEVVVEGVVGPFGPKDSPDGTNGHLGLASMHIDKVWKGQLPPNVALIYRAGSGDCSIPPPFGTRIRFGGHILSKDVLLSNDPGDQPALRRLLTVHLVVLGYPSFPEAMDMPVRDPELDALLDAYRDRTYAMERAAATKPARLAFAAHLFDNNELHRALTEYEGILSDDRSSLDLLLTLAVVRAQIYPYDEPDATLAEIERKAPRTPEWQGKIARTRFVASGRLTPGWKDWSDLTPRAQCEVSEGNFDKANFDRASLAQCEFVRSSFRNASFLHADLTDAYFENSDLTGAKYDCGTKLPDDLDPNASGMINVEGACLKP
jgi:hypothetical protein